MVAQNTTGDHETDAPESQPPSKLSTTETRTNVMNQETQTEEDRNELQEKNRDAQRARKI